VREGGEARPGKQISAKLSKSEKKLGGPEKRKTVPGEGILIPSRRRRTDQQKFQFRCRRKKGGLKEKERRRRRGGGQDENRSTILQRRLRDSHNLSVGKKTDVE